MVLSHPGDAILVVPFIMDHIQLQYYLYDSWCSDTMQILEAVCIYDKPACTVHNDYLIMRVNSHLSQWRVKEAKEVSYKFLGLRSAPSNQWVMVVLWWRMLYKSLKSLKSKQIFICNYKIRSFNLLQIVSFKVQRQFPIEFHFKLYILIVLLEC